MKINTITHGIIFEDKTHRSLYEDWQGVGRVILERQLTDQEIQQMFQSIQTSPAWNDAGGNRTMIGKGVDTARSAAGAVSGAWNKLKDQVYNSSAMSGFATQYDRAAEALKQATGGDQGLMQYVQKYRNFAEKHPIMQKAVYAALVAAAGMAGAAAGPAGIGAAVGLMQTFDKAIQGQDIRKALWSGAKAGAAAYGTAKLVDFMQSANAATPAAPAPAAPAPAPTGQETVVVAKGQTLSDIAQNNGVSVKDMMAANPQITNPDKILAGSELTLPTPTGAPVYADSVGTAADTAAKLKSGAYTDAYPASAGAPATAPAATPAAAPGAGNAAVAGVQANQDIMRQFAEKMGIDASTVSGTMKGGVPVSINGVPVPPELYSPQQLRSIQAAQEMGRWMSGGATAAEKAAAMAAAPGRTFESIIRQIPLRRIPREQLIDRDATLIEWMLNESMGQRRGGVYLTDKGVSTVFENLSRMRAVLLEADTPGALSDFGTVGAKRAAQRQAADVGRAYQGSLDAAKQYQTGASQAAAAPAAPAAKQPGFLSRAWGGIKKAGSAAGQALSKVGSEMTTKVTAQRLQSNWNKVKEYDSDRLAQWLMAAPQSVPQAVVTQVYQGMNIPMPAGSAQTTAAAAPAATPAAAPAAAPATASSTSTGQLTKDQYKQIQSQQRRQAALSDPAKKQAIQQQIKKASGKKQQLPTSASAPAAERKAAREIDAEIDDLIRALRKVDSIAAPAYVKYIRDRLDQTFGAAAAAPAASAPAKRAGKPRAAKKPEMTVQKGGTEPMSIGGQKLNPKNPKDAKLIARAQAAAK